MACAIWCSMVSSASGERRAGNIRPSRRIKTVRRHTTLEEEEGKLKEELDVIEEDVVDAAMLPRGGPGRLAMREVESSSSQKAWRCQGLSGHEASVSWCTLTAGNSMSESRPRKTCTVGSNETLLRTIFFRRGRAKASVRSAAEKPKSVATSDASSIARHSERKSLSEMMEWDQWSLAAKGSSWATGSIKGTGHWYAYNAVMSYRPNEKRPQDHQLHLFRHRLNDLLFPCAAAWPSVRASPRTLRAPWGCSQSCSCPRGCVVRQDLADLWSHPPSPRSPLLRRRSEWCLQLGPALVWKRDRSAFALFSHSTLRPGCWLDVPTLRLEIEQRIPSTWLHSVEGKFSTAKEVEPWHPLLRSDLPSLVPKLSQQLQAPWCCLFRLCFCIVRAIFCRSEVRGSSSFFICFRRRFRLACALFSFLISSAASSVGTAGTAGTGIICIVGAHCPGGPVIAVGGGEGMVMVEGAIAPLPLPLSGGGAGYGAAMTCCCGYCIIIWGIGIMGGIGIIGPCAWVVCS